MEAAHSSPLINRIAGRPVQNHEMQGGRIQKNYGVHTVPRNEEGESPTPQITFFNGLIG